MDTKALLHPPHSCCPTEVDDKTQRSNNPAVDAFHTLISDLSWILGPSSGIDSADVDPMELQALMDNYTSNEFEWEKYALNDSSRSYTRNLVDKGNGKANLLILVWNPGRGSLIHDHSNAHCIMKILKGSLKETLYSWPDQTLVQDGESSPPMVKKETIYQENEVTYISGALSFSSVDVTIFTVNVLLKSTMTLILQPRNRSLRRLTMGRSDRTSQSFQP